MAVPTITSVTPAIGHSGGKTLVEIVGTGFRLQTPPPPTGKTVPPEPSVRVQIGGRTATQVSVFSSTLLYCLTPVGDPGAPVGVRVDNLDVDGEVIAGENVTAAAAYTFERPNLSEESELARVIRAFIQEVVRQVVPNVNWATHSDYDSSTGDALNLAYVAELPAIIMANLELPESREHAVQSEQDYDADEDRFITRRPPVCVDARFDLTGVSDNPVEILNFMQAVRMFFKKNPRLGLDRDVSDASLGRVEYEMDFSFSSPVSVSRQGDGSNIESFTGVVVIRGILLEDMPGISRTKPTGIPARFPHEATVGYGFKTADDETAVTTEPTNKHVP